MTKIFFLFKIIIFARKKTMKDTKLQDILVYTDFTEVGEKSILWGLFLAKKFERKLKFIHVINENTYTYFSKDDVYGEITAVFEEMCKMYKSDYGIECTYLIDEGCTCTVINSTAEREDAFLVVLGVHGKNDPQFLSAHAAVKIIRKSRIPYFVIQKKSPLPDEKNEIILPIDGKRETKEQTGWTTYFAKHIDTNIDLIFYNTDDNRIQNNVFFCTKFFDRYELRYTKTGLQNSGYSIVRTAMSHIAPDRVLFIVAMTTKDESFMYRLFGFPETRLISNSLRLPVLCINPKKNLYIPCV